MAYEERYLTTPAPVTIGKRAMKRYQVNEADRPIEAEIAEAAYAFLPQLLPAATDDHDPAGWVILHRGRDAAYLVAYSWVWDNVVECRSAVAASAFLGCPDDDPTHFVTLDRRWMGCIWEMAPFGHERDAWIRHMLVPDKPDLSGYVADQLPAGVVPGGAQ
jgi:hypothetical protein